MMKRWRGDRCHAESNKTAKLAETTLSDVMSEDTLPTAFALFVNANDTVYTRLHRGRFSIGNFVREKTKKVQTQTNAKRSSRWSKAENSEKNENAENRSVIGFIVIGSSSESDCGHFDM